MLSLENFDADRTVISRSNMINLMDYRCDKKKSVVDPLESKHMNYNMCAFAKTHSWNLEVRFNRKNKP